MSRSHRAETSRAWPLLALAMGASAALHAWLLGASVSAPVASTPAWGRLEAKLAPGPVPAAVVSTQPAVAFASASALAAPVAQPAPEPLASPAAPLPLVATAASLPLLSQGDALVLPSAVRAVYRDAAGREAELVWRLSGARYQLLWSVRDPAAPQRVSASGSLAWSGLLPQHATRRDALHEDIEFDWSAWRTRGSREAPLRAGAIDALSLLMQVAVAHQWLSPTLRRAGWSVPVLGAGWVRLAELDGGPGAAPRYRLAWSGVAEPGPWAELELAPELAYLPVRLSQSGRAGVHDWQLARVEDLAVE